MQITTETSLGHMLFNRVADAEAFVVDIAAYADVDETFEVRPFQGNRFHIARFYNGEFEGYC